MTKAKKTSYGRSSGGFASMDPERQREIAAMGGKAVDASMRSFSTNRALAVAAGRKGGMAVPGHKRSFAANRELAAKAGRKGGASVPADKRTFSLDPTLAVEAGRKGGMAPHPDNSEDGKPQDASPQSEV